MYYRRINSTRLSLMQLLFLLVPKLNSLQIHVITY